MLYETKGVRKLKKAIIIIWCLLYVSLASACTNGDLSLQLKDLLGTEETVASSATEDTAASSQSTESATTPEQEDSYKDIICKKINMFRQVSFFVPNSQTQIHIMFPKIWKLEENDKGYSILRASKVIGSVTVSDAVDSETPETVYSKKMMMSGVNIMSRIDRVASEGETTYIRTISYRYKEDEGNSRTITITVPYQQIDDEAVWKMMANTKKHTISDPRMGILPLADNRKNILILGNSFVGTSNVGSILQKMCGTSLSVEAQSRGYARVTTYVEDESVMNRIRSGDYAAVILCGLYDSESLYNLEHMVNACESSNTPLAFFPAHNERADLILNAKVMYSYVIWLDWKEEIDSLINGGIDQSYFCIADSHKHSTPLAGYVGAHMVYRAIFGKVPAETSYSGVSSSEIALLGEYASTGSISYSKPDSTYPLKAG